MINVVGDVGLVLGTFFIFRHTHTVDSCGTFQAAPHVFAHNSTDLVAGCLLLLVGAFAKSAQVPLHTWLPDAMEGQQRLAGCRQNRSNGGCHTRQPLGGALPGTSPLWTTELRNGVDFSVRSDCQPWP